MELEDLALGSLEEGFGHELFLVAGFLVGGGEEGEELVAFSIGGGLSGTVGSLIACNEICQDFK